MARSANQVLAVTLRKLARSEHSDGMRRIIGKSHPADLAHVMRSLTSPQQTRVFREIRPLKKAADVLMEMEPALSERIIADINDDFLALLIAEMAPEEVASVLRTIDAPRKELLLSELSFEEASEAEALAIYDPKSAGALMSPNYFVVYAETTTSEAIQKLHRNEYDIIFYLYVINDHGQLVGVVSLRELVRAQADTMVKDIMFDEVVRVDVRADREDVAALVARYNLLALPVTETGNQLVGVVTVDDIIDVIRLEATEDIMHAAGAGGEASPNESLSKSIRSRLPWILPTFLAGVAGIVLLSFYPATLVKVVPLLVLIPMIMGISGHVGAQSSTIVTRWLATGRLEFAEVRRVILREIFIGATFGFVFGIAITVLVSIFFQDLIFSNDKLVFAIGVGVSSIVSTSLAAALGSTTPLVFERSGFDPAIAAGPLVTTTIDVLALWIYLLTATLFL